MDFCVLKSSECRVLAASLLGGDLGRVGADLGRVVCVALAGPMAAGFLGGPALPNGEEVLAARAFEAVGLAAAAAFPSIRFGAILDHDPYRGSAALGPGFAHPDVWVWWGGGISADKGRLEQRRCLGNTWYLNTCTRVTQIQA